MSCMKQLIAPCRSLYSSMCRCMAENELHPQVYICMHTVHSLYPIQNMDLYGKVMKYEIDGNIIKGGKARRDGISVCERQSNIG